MGAHACAQSHPYFDGIEWAQMAARTVRPPWTPPPGSIRLDTTIHPKDVAMEKKLRVCGTV